MFLSIHSSHLSSKGLTCKRARKLDGILGLNNQPARQWQTSTQPDGPHRQRKKRSRRVWYACACPFSLLIISTSPIVPPRKH